jgi:hypothetical protein
VSTIERGDQLGKGGARNLAIAVYNPKQGGTGNRHVAIAISGKSGELLDEQQIEIINKALEGTKESRKELNKSISSSNEKPEQVPSYKLASLDKKVINRHGNKYMVDNGTPVGMLTEEGFATLFQNDQREGMGKTFAI